MTRIGEFLGGVRDISGRTQAEVAKLRQTSRGAQSQLELRNANPTWATIEQFAIAVGARVSLRFELANGTSAEMIAGQIAPKLLSDLESERARWKKGRNFESATATRIAEAVEPSQWTRQNALRVLFAAVVADNPRQGPTFLDSWDVGHWEDDDGNVSSSGSVYVPHEIGVLEENRITFRGLMQAVASLVRIIGNPALADQVSNWVASWQIPAVAAYIREGTPGAESIAEQLTALAEDNERIDQLLAKLGYLPENPFQKVEHPADV